MRFFDINVIKRFFNGRPVSILEETFNKVIKKQINEKLSKAFVDISKISINNDGNQNTLDVVLTRKKSFFLQEVNYFTYPAYLSGNSKDVVEAFVNKMNCDIILLQVNEILRNSFIRLSTFVGQGQRLCINPVNEDGSIYNVTIVLLNPISYYFDPSKKLDESAFDTLCDKIYEDINKAISTNSPFVKQFCAHLYGSQITREGSRSDNNVGEIFYLDSQEILDEINHLKNQQIKHSYNEMNCNRF